MSETPPTGAEWVEAIVKAVEVWAARSAYGLKSWDGLLAVIEGGMAPQPRDEGRNTG